MVTSNSVALAECTCSCGEANDSPICCFELDRSINIAPLTCHGLQITSSGILNLRFRLRSDIGRPDIDLDLCRSASEKLVTQMKSSDTLLSADNLRSMPFMCHCLTCGAKLLDSQKFDRVLALPSDNWLDGSESWWCHGGGHCHSATETCSSATHDVELSLSMKPQDCLVGDSCIVVSDEALIDGSCLSHDSHLIRCLRCRSIVGRDLNAEWNNNQSAYKKCSNKDVAHRYIRLYAHSLFVRSANASLPAEWGYKSEDLELKLASYFLEERCQSNHFRFVVETRDCKNSVIPIIVLWVMDTDTVMFTGHHTASSTVSSHRLAPIPVIKLLYKDCLRDSNKSVGLTWYRDATVHNVELPELICHQLLRQLVDSTMSLPVSLRSTGSGFYVGFLRRPGAASY